MAYYNYKLKENGINPKPCAITDDDGEVVADDFPPDYNYLQDYVYKIVSSFDFIESPEECTIKIADRLCLLLLLQHLYFRFHKS